MFNYFSGKTKRGELSIFPKSFIVLSHCLHMMPRQKAGPGSDNANVKVNRVCFVIDLVPSGFFLTSIFYGFCTEN